MENSPFLLEALRFKNTSASSSLPGTVRKIFIVSPGAAGFEIESAILISAHTGSQNGVGEGQFGCMRNPLRKMLYFKRRFEGSEQCRWLRAGYGQETSFAEAYRRTARTVLRWWNLDLKVRYALIRSVRRCPGHSAMGAGTGGDSVKANGTLYWRKWFGRRKLLRRFLAAGQQDHAGETSDESA